MGVLPMLVISLLVVMVGDSIKSLATLAVFGILVFQMIVGYAAFCLPHRMPELYQGLPFKLRPNVLKFVATGLIMVSLLALVALAIDEPGMLMKGIAFALLGTAYYKYFCKPEQAFGAR
jgi:hypothetical protein